MAVSEATIWTVYACPIHGPDQISETFGTCGALVDPGAGYPHAWCGREAQWFKVRVVEDDGHAG
jgi:hypothetical protein